MDTLYTQQLSKLEKTHEILLDCEEIKPVNPKGNQSRVFIGRTDAEAKAPSNTLATWCEKLTHWKRPWSWARLKAGGEGDDRGWYGWMASPTQWTRVWVNSESWCWIVRSGMLQSMGLQRIVHNCMTELNCTEIWILKEFIGHITQKYRAKEWTNYFYTYKHESPSKM